MPPSPLRLPWASRSPTARESAVVGSSCTTTPALARSTPSTGGKPRRADMSRLVRRERLADSLCRGGHEWAVRRRTRNARHLGVGAGSLGVDRPQAGAATGGSARPAGIRRRRDLPAADCGQRRTLLPRSPAPGSCSSPAVRPPRWARFCATRTWLAPTPRWAARNGLSLRGAAWRGDRRDGEAAAGCPGLHAHRPARPHGAARPGRSTAPCSGHPR